MGDKNIIVLSHCILNKYSKLQSSNSKKPDIVKLIKYLLDNNIGIVQLPCPEMHMYGAKRWGHTKDQFDTPFFRETSRQLIEPICLQIRDYLNNGYSLLGVVGIEGSPSCGGIHSCTGSEWGGDFKDLEKVGEKISTIKYGETQGVFMEVLKENLEGWNIEPKFFGLLSEEVDRLIEEIDSYMKETSFK